MGTDLGQLKRRMTRTWKRRCHVKLGSLQGLRMRDFTNAWVYHSQPALMYRNDLSSFPKSESLNVTLEVRRIF